MLVFDRPLRPGDEGLLKLGSGSGRLEAWRDAVPVVGLRPLLGHGYATTAVVFPQYQRPGEFGESFASLHNGYLDLALELGWPAATAIAVVAGSGAIAAARVARRSSEWAPLGAALAGGTAGGLMETMFESGLLAAGGLFAFHFWMVAAMAHAADIRSRRPVT